MREKRTILAYLALAICLAFAAWLAGLAVFIQNAASISTPPELHKKDAIVVLTGGSNRVDTGFDLLEKGLGKKLFISGVYRGIEVKNLLKRWKSEPQSNLDCCVVLGFEADNTTGNAVETVNWLRHEHFHSVYLVTANYHIQRAMLEFKDLAPDLALSPYPVVPDKVDLANWWKDPATRSLILREYMKYIAVYLRYSMLHA